MADVGMEVGQKMRLAIKAKLTELNCYVDDELPDYIMVMIANKRTKSQMKEDLNLFLSTETSFFVEWLHIVLKKLKQVQVTNPNVFKNPIKRKSNEFVISAEDYKKVKKEEGKVKKEKDKEQCEEHVKSLTDDLPITANRLSDRRKIVLLETNQAMNENESLNFTQGIEDDFDIPLLSEINASNEEELALLEKRIKNVKSRLGLQVESDKEEDEEDENDDSKDCLSIKPDPAEMDFHENPSKSPPRRFITAQRTLKRVESSRNEEKSEETRQLEKQLEMKRSIHARIIFDKEKDSLKAKYDSIMKRNHHNLSGGSPEKNSETKKRSILDRLGKRPERTDNSDSKSIQSKVIRPQKDRQERQERSERSNRLRSEKNFASTILSRVGVLSKVSIPQKATKNPEINAKLDDKHKKSSYQSKRLNDGDTSDENERKNVQSVVKVKPRVLPSKTKQANPNLLFKAVAEAQRSVNQTPSVGAGSKSQENEKINPKSIKITAENTENKEKHALFTKKYKEQLALANATKKSEDVAKLDQKHSIIINKNRKAKLLDDEKLKLRCLLTQQSQQQSTGTTKTPKKVKPNESDDLLNLDPSFDDDYDFETKSNASNSSETSAISSRTPELTSKQIDLQERELFLKSQITIENKPDAKEESLLQIKFDSDDSNSALSENESEAPKTNHKFIVTLDGIDKSKFAHIDDINPKINEEKSGNVAKIKYPEESLREQSAPSFKDANFSNENEVKKLVKATKIIKTKRSPSPIVFDAVKPMVAVAPTKTKMASKPAAMHVQANPLNSQMKSQMAPVQTSKIVANERKEKCKYFPNCRQGERCEFLHPTMCKMFPNCKFAEMCVYLHPTCKFEMSCTRKNCPYSHGATNTKSSGVTSTSAQTVCKYFPNCSNSYCPYYHPKMCKYGLHCKNASCVFQHPSGHSSSTKLTWRLVK